MVERKSGNKCLSENFLHKVEIFWHEKLVLFLAERKWHKFDWDKNAISPIFGWDLKTSQEGAKDIWAVSVQPVDIIFDLETLNSGQKSKILQIPDGTLKRLNGNLFDWYTTHKLELKRLERIVRNQM